MHATTIDEPVLVQARFLPGGEVRPTAFVWQERTRYLAGVGRRWTEETGTGTWHCFLAQTMTGDTVELRWHATSHQWRLQRAWWRDAVV